MLTVAPSLDDACLRDNDASRRAHPKVLIYRSEALRIARFVHEYPDVETGGDLFGHWTHSGNPVISYVLGPGCLSQHRVTSFYQDERFLHDVGTRLYDHYGLQHVGEWHSHHRLGLNCPSDGDITTIENGMGKQGWDRFLLMIATLRESVDSPVIHNYYLFEGSNYRPAAVALLPGSSPFRTRPGEPGEESTHRTIAHVQWEPGPFSPAPAKEQTLSDRYARAWFSTPEGKAQVRRIVSSLERKRIKYRIYGTKDGCSLKLRLPDASLLLGPRFPNEPPQIVVPTSSGGKPRTPQWDSTTNLVDWYCSFKRR